MSLVNGETTPATEASQVSPASAANRWASHLLRTPLIAASTAAFGAASLAVSRWDSSGRRQHTIASRWARALLRISGSPVTLLHGERLSRFPAAVYAANHLSYMDTPVIFGKLPFQFRILARHDLFRIPFMGWHLRRSGQIPVDSSSLRSQVASLNLGVAALKAGMPLVVFPEGGRSEDGLPHSFMSGPAWMAIRANVPIVPLTLVGTHELLPMHVYHLRPRPLLLIVGEPIPTQGLTSKDANALTERVHDAIALTYFEFFDGISQSSELTVQS